MTPSLSLAQGSLAAVILISTYGAHLALSPPNKSAPPPGKDKPNAGATRDSLARGKIVTPLFRAIVLGPCAILSLHAAALTLTYPAIPVALAGFSTQNGLNPALTTWSAATAVPLAIILLGGVPLRLASYSSLGRNFTFALSRPSDLNTGGMYRYVQHPSYTGLYLLMLGIVGFLGRLDGVLGCWLPPALHAFLQDWTLAIIPAASVITAAGIWVRVREEEDMLRGQFGEKWERWHASTARFIPFIL